LTHIQLTVSDVKRSLEFYQSVFGMEVQYWHGSKMVFLRTPGAKDTITLAQAGKGRPIASGGVAHFGFRRAEGQDLDGAIKAVEAAGGRLIERGEHAPGRPYAYVSDLDGYTIEL
jgi:catechol 2,3-dioxygenase-like lactoylglutathione lyase family enzyme